MASDNVARLAATEAVATLQQHVTDKMAAHQAIEK
jgi:hypothetical protein